MWIVIFEDIGYQPSATGPFDTEEAARIYADEKGGLVVKLDPPELTGHWIASSRHSP